MANDTPGEPQPARRAPRPCSMKPISGTSREPLGRSGNRTWLPAGRGAPACSLSPPSSGQGLSSWSGTMTPAGWLRTHSRAKTTAPAFCGCFLF